MHGVNGPENIFLFALLPIWAITFLVWLSAPLYRRNRRQIRAIRSAQRRSNRVPGGTK